MTPILVLLFGVSPATAVGTDLLFAAATKRVGSFVHGFNRTINWRVVRRLAMGSIPATLLVLVGLPGQLGTMLPLLPPAKRLQVVGAPRRAAMSSDE